MDTTVINREAVVARIEELRAGRDELATLEGVLAVLDGATVNGAAPKARKRSTSATATKRAPRGQRPEQMIELIGGTPGITASDLASEMGVNVNYVYKLAGDLGPDGEGKIVKRGRGYFYLPDHPAEDGPKNNPGDAQATPEGILGARIAEDMLARIRANPGITAPELSKALDLSHMRTHHVLWPLLGGGLIERVRDGSRFRYSIAEDAAQEAA